MHLPHVSTRKVHGMSKEGKVRRLEIIDHTASAENQGQSGRILVKMDWKLKVELSYQDDDRTLKIFLTDRS